MALPPAGSEPRPRLAKLQARQRAQTSEYACGGDSKKGASLADVNPWTLILNRLKAEVAEEDYRRWFGATAYASDSGDQITIWVPSEPIRRHIELHYQDL